ncbi:MAG TPA: peptidase M48 [Noviherbaspirillum sp.]
MKQKPQNHRAATPALHKLLSLACIGLTACAAQRPLPQPVASPSPQSALTKAAPSPAPAMPTPAPLPPPAVEAAPPMVAPDETTTLRLWVGQQSRLYRVAAPLLISNTELCPDHARSLLGFTAKTKYSYSDDYADAAQNALGLGDALQVMDVLPGTGAEAVGLRHGDVLVAAEIEPLPQGPGAEHEAAAIIGSEMQGRSELHLTIERDGERLAPDVPLTPACAMVVQLGNTETVNSYSDGHRVMITRGMLDFVTSDLELAYVLAREMATNVIEPRPAMDEIIDALHTLSPEAGVSDPTPVIAPFSAAADAAIDELALDMVARAGFPVEGAFRFWQRLAATYPANVPDSHTSLHPSVDVRLDAVRRAIDAIDLKRMDDDPLHS